MAFKLILGKILNMQEKMEAVTYIPTLLVLSQEKQNWTGLALLQIWLAYRERLPGFRIYWKFKSILCYVSVCIRNTKCTSIQGNLNPIRFP